MNKKWITMAAVGAAICGAAEVAQALPITGDITFDGGVTLNTASAGTATEVLSWTGAGGMGMPTVVSADGSFSGIAGGTSVTMSAPWFFNSGPVADLWSVGGFTFNLTSSSIVSQPAGGVIVDGIGSVSGNGLDSEAMDWSFSTQDPGAIGVDSLVFSFSASSGTTGAVPDGGTTAMLLGLSVLGLGLLKKQMLA